MAELLSYSLFTEMVLGEIALCEGAHRTSVSKSHLNFFLKAKLLQRFKAQTSTPLLKSLYEKQAISTFNFAGSIVISKIQNKYPAHMDPAFENVQSHLMKMSYSLDEKRIIDILDAKGGSVTEDEIALELRNKLNPEISEESITQMLENILRDLGGKILQVETNPEPAYNTLSYINADQDSSFLSL